jgi:hypothetical protein
MKITLDQLRSLRACDEQVVLFEKLFGSEVELTEVLLLEYGGQFDLDWLAKKLFKGDILDEYQETCELIWAEYQKARKPIWAEYEKAHEPILAEYLKAREPIEAEYQKTLTLVFWACVLEMEVRK